MDIEERGKLYTFDWNGIRFSAVVDDFMVYHDEEPDGRRSVTIDDLQVVVRVHIDDHVEDITIPLSTGWEDYWPKELWKLVNDCQEFIQNDLEEMGNDGEFDSELDCS